MISFAATTTGATNPQGFVFTATYAGFSRSSQLDVVAVTSLGLDPGSVVRGSNSTATVTITPQAMTAPVVVSLASSSPDVTVPATVTVTVSPIPTATFDVTTRATAAPGPYVITATLPGSSAQATLSVTGGQASWDRIAGCTRRLSRSSAPWCPASPPVAAAAAPPPIPQDSDR